MLICQGLVTLYITRSSELGAPEILSAYASLIFHIMDTISDKSLVYEYSANTQKRSTKVGKYKNRALVQIKILLIVMYVQ